MPTLVKVALTTSVNLPLKADKRIPAYTVLSVDFTEPSRPALTVEHLPKKTRSKADATPPGLEVGQTFRISGKGLAKAMGWELPVLAELEEWSSDAICPTPTGDDVEPDGIGPDGVPSWLMLLGYI